MVKIANSKLERSIERALLAIQGVENRDNSTLPPLDSIIGILDPALELSHTYTSGMITNDSPLTPVDEGYSATEQVHETYFLKGGLVYRVVWNPETDPKLLQASEAPIEKNGFVAWLQRYPERSTEVASYLETFIQTVKTGYEVDKDCAPQREQVAAEYV